MSCTQMTARCTKMTCFSDNTSPTQHIPHVAQPTQHVSCKTSLIKHIPQIIYFTYSNPRHSTYHTQQYNTQHRKHTTHATQASLTHRNPTFRTCKTQHGQHIAHIIHNTCHTTHTTQHSIYSTQNCVCTLLYVACVCSRQSCEPCVLGPSHCQPPSGYHLVYSLRPATYLGPRGRHWSLGTWSLGGSHQPTWSLTATPLGACLWGAMLALPVPGAVAGLRLSTCEPRQGTVRVQQAQDPPGVWCPCRTRFPTRMWGWMQCAPFSPSLSLTTA